MKSENERKNVTMESSRQDEYINYIFVETGTNKYNESKMQEISDITMNKTDNKEENESHNMSNAICTNKINKTMRKDKFYMRTNISRIISRSKKSVQPNISKGRKRNGT